MTVDDIDKLLTVDPSSLATQLVPEQEWTCAETDDDHQAKTRYLSAIHKARDRRGNGKAQTSEIIVNGGMVHGAQTGSFVTGDLCPSRKPLDREFFKKLAMVKSPFPIALSISGLWLIHHDADFQWLREQQRAGALQISWVDHSFDHPYVKGRDLKDNFLLEPGVDMRSEILDTEELLIAKGETPSVFFRFPGLISSLTLMQIVSDYHLIALGADSWLAQSERVRPGGIILVHPNGNEPDGLKTFQTLLADGKLPEPFQPIEDAP